MKRGENKCKGDQEEKIIKARQSFCDIDFRRRETASIWREKEASLENKPASIRALGLRYVLLGE